MFKLFVVAQEGETADSGDDEETGLNADAKDSDRER